MKALVVGGSSGVGLCLSEEMAEKGFAVSVIDKKPPVEGNFPFKKLNLCDDDYSILNNYLDTDVLVITAGFGRVAFFQDLTAAEVQNLIKVDALSVAKILQIFYSKILGKTPFYCLVFGSISGFISSPLFSVYGASKSFVSRLIESLNAELEFQKSPNRILNVSPGSLKGTSFSGGSTDTNLLRSISRDAICKMLSRETLFIPDFETYGPVLSRYQNNCSLFGQESIHYKISHNRLNPHPQISIGYLSGTFDLFHVGHLNILKRAKECCDYLVVGVHKDGSHKNKEVFIPLEERKSIVRSIRYVDEVIDAPSEDSDAWAFIHYNFLFVGSDYEGSDRFHRYEQFFKDKGVKIVYFPYTQGTSSTQLRLALSKVAAREEKK